MARKFGKTNTMSENFSDYSYVINGVGGIGKTTMVYEIGKQTTGNNEGTFIITLGEEPAPKHIPNAFGDVAPDFKTFIAIIKELCENKSEYPYTKFIALDSMDELCRITENYVVAEWNASCSIEDRAKSIKQAYKGYQAGENRVCDLFIQYLGKLKSAGYQLLEIGHTKTKVKEDPISGISYEQITCNLDNKYYNALKDKVNLVATCYLEKTIENIEEKKNAFTKKLDKIGNLTSEKRVIVFRDDDMAIDTKSHFKYIVPKVEFGTASFIKAVEDAIAEEIKISSSNNSSSVSNKSEIKPIIKKEIIKEEISIEDEVVIDDIADETETIDKETLMSEIREKFKEADKDTKTKIKAILTEKGSGRLDDSLSVDVLNEVKTLL